MEQNRFVTEVAVLRPALQRKALAMYEGDEARAEDSVSELLLRLWQNRTKLDEVESIPAYCHTLLRNLIIDDLRRSRTLSLDEDTMPNEESIDTVGHYELGELLRRAIASLPPLSRSVYELHDMQGYSSEEIAELLGLRTDAVYNHLSRARRKLRDYLAPLVR